MICTSKRFTIDSLNIGVDCGDVGQWGVGMWGNGESIFCRNNPTALHPHRPTSLAPHYPNFPFKNSKLLRMSTRGTAAHRARLRTTRRRRLWLPAGAVPVQRAGADIGQAHIVVRLARLGQVLGMHSRISTAVARQQVERIGAAAHASRPGPARKPRFSGDAFSSSQSMASLPSNTSHLPPVVVILEADARRPRTRRRCCQAACRP